MTKVELDKREHILEVAENLFAQYGFDGTSTRALAKEADINLGMLTYYFGTKDKILEALIDKKLSFYRTNLEEIKKHTTSAKQMMEAVIDLYIDHMLVNTKFHRIMNMEVYNNKHPQIKVHAYTAIKKNADYICNVIEEGIKNKEFKKDCDPQLFMISLTGTIMNYIKSEYFTLNLLKQNPEKDSISSPENKERIRLFLKNYLHSYLLKPKKNTK